MPLHLLKLCVGIDEPDELVSHHRNRLNELRAAGKPAELGHTTRSMPRRREEVLDGGSLYWVIKGAVQVRQPIIDLRSVRGGDGIERCRIVLGTPHVATVPTPKRPFQGWRYLENRDAPGDIETAEASALPAELRRELATLGLL